MEQTELSEYKEKRDYKTWIYYLGLVVITFVIACLWICCAKSPESCFWTMMITNSTFLVLFVTNVWLLWTVYKTESKKEETRNEFNRKITWENFQYELYKANNDKRFEYEQQKYFYDKVKDIANEFNREKPTSKEVDELKKSIGELKKQKEAQLIVEFNKNENKAKTK